MDLDDHGFRVCRATDATEALRAPSEDQIGLVLLEPGVPRIAGESLIGRFRREFDISIIVRGAGGRESRIMAALAWERIVGSCGYLPVYIH